MAFWFSRLVRSHGSQLLFTGIVSGAFAVALVLAYQEGKKRVDLKLLKASIPGADEPHETGQLTEYGFESAPSRDSDEAARGTALAQRARIGDYDEELLLEQLARNRLFLGERGLSSVRSAFVIVVGCGGVGSHAAAALARSGVARLRLIDFDQVTLSSLNRHAVATLADVGTAKVDCLRKRLEQIAPWAHFDCRAELFGAQSAAAQLAPWRAGLPPADYVVDAIDNVDSKVALLQHCRGAGLPVVSCMGAACKSDPTRVLLGDISATAEDRLSRATRRRLRLLGVAAGIAAVFSAEKTSDPAKAQLQPLAEHALAGGDVHELAVLPRFRVRTLPVLGTMPAVFGLCAANHVILELSGYPHDYLQTKARDKMYDSILASLQAGEERLARRAGHDALGLRIPISLDDVAFLVEEIYRGRSVVSGLPTKLLLSRWRTPLAEPLDCSTPGQKCARLRLSDLVCLTKEEALRHDTVIFQQGKSPEDLYDRDTIDLVRRRQDEAEAYERFR